MPLSKERERLSWRCRRGLLELDLILARFSERHLTELDAKELSALDTLLIYPDNELLDFVMGRKTCPDPGLRVVIELMQTA
jgi:antitoxin CptB